MKSFIYIFSCYLLFLSLIPCSDEAYAATKDEVKISVRILDAHSEHGLDSCTLFCQCSCCSASVIAQYNTKANTRILKEDVLRFYFTDLFLSPYAHNIWQPPQLKA